MEEGKKQERGEKEAGRGRKGQDLFVEGGVREGSPGVLLFSQCLPSTNVCGHFSKCCCLHLFASGCCLCDSSRPAQWPLHCLQEAVSTLVSAVGSAVRLGPESLKAGALGQVT